MTDDLLETNIGEKRFNMQDRWLETLDNLKRQIYLKASEGKDSDFAFLVKSLFFELKSHLEINTDTNGTEVLELEKEINKYSNLINHYLFILMRNPLDESARKGLSNSKNKLLEKMYYINYYMHETNLIFPREKKVLFRELIKMSF
jgi:hypothetical protein